MLEDLALSGEYTGKIDDKYRIIFPSDFRQEVKGKIGHNYYLLIRTQNNSKGLRVEPISKEKYDELVVQMNRKAEGDSTRTEFFKQWRRKVDKQGRFTLTEYLIELLNANKGNNLYFSGRGNYCELSATKNEVMTI